LNPNLLIYVAGRVSVLEEKPESIFKSFWHKHWTSKSEAEKKRLKSYIPLFMYTFAFLYGVVYLSILNTVNRNQTGSTVRSGFGDKTYAQRQAEKLKKEIDDSFVGYRKRVSGGR
jgi:hypothetical protein